MALNWITDVLTTNQWIVVWLGFGLVFFVAIYITWAQDPDEKLAGRFNPLPALFLATAGTLVLSMGFMGVGALIDGLIWMWNN